MTTNPQTDESARALLWRHGLPEDIVDGALCLHAQELAAVQRREADDLHQTEPGVVKGLRIGADLIDPTKAAAVSVPAPAPTDWIDGHPQLEAIAAAVWERCGRSDSGTCIEDDPRNIAVAALAAVLPLPADQAAELSRLRAKVFEWQGSYLAEVKVRQERDAEIARLRADRAAVLRAEADAIDATRAPFPIAVQNGITWATAELRRAAAASGSGRVADETQAEARAALITELLPAWEAVYEPGNVSDYLIGYANDQDVATGAAEAWLRSQAEVTGRLEWVSEDQLAAGRYDRWFELIERHGDGIDTGPGVIVRRRVEPAVVSQTDGEA
ncbi:hypothetical protein ACFXAW_07155 [Streptomyces sp. NPDC059445]|uniref:hypothetical protein n=1 Tax=Streptomyces sp. NPDC059445 TaxID=3346832 RepID=UPI0036968878